MNERIRELAEQAKLRPALLLKHLGTFAALTDSEQEELKNIAKFAELVQADEREALEEIIKQEPVGHADLDINNVYIFSALEDRRIPVGRIPLYTAPRQWQGLSDQEIVDLLNKYFHSYPDLIHVVHMIEAKLKEKNG